MSNREDEWCGGETKRSVDEPSPTLRLPDEASDDASENREVYD
jgi:hypothetical protein